MSLDYKNEHCEIAAQILDTEPDLLDSRLIERLNALSYFVQRAGGELHSRQVIALVILQWKQNNSQQ